MLKMNTSAEESSTKKRRLESEASQTSGITLLSSVTQTTELSSDFEDNNSDSSSTNQADGLCDRRPSATNSAIQKAQVKRAKRQFIRKRQVSWNFDEDETFEKDERSKNDTPVQSTFPVSYDNNFSGTNNSRRVRRLTESSLDPYAFSFNKKKSPLNESSGQNSRSFQPKLRSNTTSQIYGHEQELQRKIDELIRQHDAKMVQSRRSQSVTSLRKNNVQNRSDSNLYESLQPQNTAQKTVIDNRPVQTVVSLTSEDSNYLHPVTKTHVHRNDEGKSENTSISLGYESSAYADVVQKNEKSERGQGQQKCYDICDDSFYRKWFYILLIFNVILILLNSFGLPFVYFAIKQEEDPSKPPNINEGGVATSTLRSKFCVKCDKLHEMVKRELSLSGEFNVADKRCCFSSAEKILPALLRIVDGLASAPKTETVPVIQLKADKNKNSENTVLWESRPEIDTYETNGTNKAMKVPKNGYYYVYSRVHYKKPGDEGNSEMFTIGHSIVKKEKQNGEKSTLDKVVQRCFPSNTTGDVIHTNNLGSVHYLKEGDSLSIELDHKKYFHYENTIFGMFRVAT